MNTNPNAIRILCYGDSNTHGTIPETYKRYKVNERWTGILQNKLGSNYEIIEEGLNARTTNIDDPKHVGKNGLTYLTPCLQSHYPLDIIVLMLGTNDLKYRFNRDSQTIAGGMQALINEIKNNAIEEEETMPKVILICPSTIIENIEENKGKDKFEGGEIKSLEFTKLYENIAKNNNLIYINLQEHIKPSKIDGLHFEISEQHTIAKLVEKEILSLT